MNVADAALLDLLRLLDARGYDFTTPAPDTHRRVLRRRRGQKAGGLADIFGWNLPFEAADVDPALIELLRRAGALVSGPRRLRSALRVARVGARLFLHSGFPARQGDAVFFGPDSYRFAELLRVEAGRLPGVGRIIDIGTGTGVGGIIAGHLHPQAAVVLTDVNPKAVRLARINADFAGIAADLAEGSGLDPVAGDFDLAIANPPYLGGGVGRLYRDGGGGLGSALSLAWARDGLRRLSAGGRMVLYTGAPIVRGHDRMHAALAEICAANACDLTYREIEPDVFPGTLAHPAYWRVERIAAVGAVMVRRT